MHTESNNKNEPAGENRKAYNNEGKILIQYGKKFTF